MHYEISLGDSKNVRSPLTNYNKVENLTFCSIYRFYSNNLFISGDEFFILDHLNPKSCGIDCQCDTVAVEEWLISDLIPKKSEKFKFRKFFSKIERDS